MKIFYAILFSCVLLTSCQRKTTAVVEETKTIAEAQPVTATKAPLKTKTLEGTNPAIAKTDKQFGNKDSLIKSTDPIQETPLMKNAEQNNYKALYDSGYQKHNAGDFKGAIADFSKCISMNPEFSDAFNFRGMSKYKSGDKPGACSDWNKALGLGYSQAQSMIDKFCK